jgi:hypothetical protein
MFKLVDERSFPDWLKDIDTHDQRDVLVKEDDESGFDLLSPIASANKKGIFEVFPSLSFDSVSSEDEDSPGSMLSSEKVSSKVLNLEKPYKSMQVKLIHPFTDIEASYLAMVQEASHYTPCF